MWFPIFLEIFPSAAYRALVSASDVCVWCTVHGRQWQNRQFYLFFRRIFKTEWKNMVCKILPNFITKPILTDGVPRFLRIITDFLHYCLRVCHHVIDALAGMQICYSHIIIHSYEWMKLMNGSSVHVMKRALCCAVANAFWRCTLIFASLTLLDENEQK